MILSLFAAIPFLSIKTPTEFKPPLLEETAKVKKVEPVKPKPVTYVVKEGDTLTSISSHFQIDLKRLWSANTTLPNPDLITPGMALNVPNSGDVVADRPFPAAPAIIETTAPSLGSPRLGFSFSFDIAPAGWFPVGQCTQYVWSRRPVGKWGNASEWVYNARRDGVATGNIPRVGAVGQRGNHVVYIEQVAGDRVYLSERNYDYNGSYRERWASASDFVYIY